jgi:four helix bundle protein
VQNFRDLEVWAKAHELALDVYCATSSGPREELDGLTSQLRRSAVAVPSNSAEGCCRSQGDFARFVLTAMGSASELEYPLLLAKDLGFLKVAQFQTLSDEATERKRMRTALRSRLTADG